LICWCRRYWWPLAADGNCRSRGSIAQASFSRLQHLGLDAPEEEFGGSLSIVNLVETAEKVPSDLKRAFHKRGSGSVIREERRPPRTVPAN
jgi:hypothetical protein